MKLRTFLTLGIFVFSSSCYAGEVAKGQIIEVANLIGQDKLFSIKMSPDSTGPCAGQWVKFKEENFAGNLENYKFAFSIALTALASDKKVRVHNYINDTCDGVTFIGVYK